MRHFFTSESVCAGHPDKICDGISDAILDAILAQDPNSRAGIETVAGANKVALYGEIKTTAEINFELIVKNKITELGYTNPAWGFSIESEFSNDVHKQSPEIALGVDLDGAGDQGMMFGFAIDDTPELMPLPIALAHALARRIDEARESKQLLWLRPDGKAQVTVAYEDGKPVAVEKLVLAVAHDEKATHDEVRAGAIKEIILRRAGAVQIRPPGRRRYHHQRHRPLAHSRPGKRCRPDRTQDRRRYLRRLRARRRRRLQRQGPEQS